MADASENTSVNTQTAQPQGTFDSSGKNMSMMISEMLAGINSISDAIGYLKDRKTEEKDSDGGKSVSEMLAKTVSDMRQSVYDGYMAALSDERQMEAEDKEAVLQTKIKALKNPRIQALFAHAGRLSPKTQEALNKILLATGWKEKQGEKKPWK